MYGRLKAVNGAELCTWIACVGAAAAAAAAVVLPTGRLNRVQGAAAPLVVVVVLLLVNGIAWRRMAWAGAVVYGIAAVALMYGVGLALSVPLRLSIEGICKPSATTCPLGFAYPITSGENEAVYVIAVAGACSLMFVLVAFELRHIRRRPHRETAPPRKEGSM